MGLEGLFGTFAMLADVHAAFEATDIKHQLRRVGFEPTPYDARAPLLPNAFFGDIVLTRPSGRANTGPSVAQSEGLCYCGVLVVSVLDGLCCTESLGRPELQVGLVMSTRTWDTDDEERFDAWRRGLGSMWTAARGAARRSLVARQDALDLIEATEDDHLVLRKARDHFFNARWNELASIPRLGERGIVEPT